MSDDIHSCSYYCEYPACIKRQRDYMRERLLERKWVGLTDDDIDTLQLGLMREYRHGTYALARAVEKLLEEKNT